MPFFAFGFLSSCVPTKLGFVEDEEEELSDAMGAGEGLSCSVSGFSPNGDEVRETVFQVIMVLVD